jgi:hypothetical protein
MNKIKLLTLILFVINVLGSYSYKRSVNGYIPNGLALNGIINGININGIYNGLALNGVIFNGGSFNGGSMNGYNNGAMNGWANGLYLESLVLNNITLDLVNDSTVLVNGVLNVTREPLVDFFHYFSICALALGDKWNASINDTNYQFSGAFGLAKYAKERNLTESEERWITACLLGFVNIFGRHIEISVRSKDVIDASKDEIERFRTYEGAFFGSITDLNIYSCQGEEKEKAVSESSSRKWRACTDENNNCTMTKLGKCADICTLYTPNYGWKDCFVNGTKYEEVVNVFLESDSEPVSSSASHLHSFLIGFIIFILLFQNIA